MSRQRISATALERHYIARRVTEANAAEALAKEVFSMFCEGHGVPGATFLGIEGDTVVVDVVDVPASAEMTPGRVNVGILP